MSARLLAAKALTKGLNRPDFYFNLGATQDARATLIGNTEVSPVTVYKKGPNSIVIQDVNTGATETFTAAQINENFTRMTEEAMAKEDGVQLTPQDVADFQKNTETINETLEDSEALNAAAKAVEEAEKKGTFRDRLKNKNCNI